MSSKYNKCHPFIERIGEESINYQGVIMKIIDYTNAHHVLIEFQNKYKNTSIVKYQHFKRGKIKDSFYPNVLNVGFIGNTKSCKNGIEKYSYNSWINMLTRCYSHKERYKAYFDCHVCDEWLCYENFEKWFDENCWLNNLRLDKDILVKGNKVYSPETCVLVTNEINVLFCKANSIRGNLPIGVRWDKERNKYVSQCYIKGKGKNLGYYKNSTYAFNKYKEIKEQNIKNIADEYKQKYPNFPDKLYNAMYNYKVEIID